jgi:hypothetical protein
MSIVTLAVFAVLASIIVSVLHKIRKDRELKSDLLRMETELNELLGDRGTTELDIDLWEARRYPLIDNLERQGQASDLINRLRHFHVA